MADMIVVYRVMPEDSEIEYSQLEELVKEKVQAYDTSVQIKEVKPQNVGFGLQAVNVKFQLDENCGSENLENQIKEEKIVGDVVIELMDRL